MNVREQIKHIESKMRERHQSITKAQGDLEKRKREAEAEIDEIDRKLSQKLALYHLGVFENEKELHKEILGLKSERTKVQDFLNDYPLIKKGLEAENSKQDADEHALSKLRNRAQEYDDLLNRFKKGPRWRSEDDKTKILELAEELGDLEEAKAELKKIENFERDKEREK